MKGKPKKLKTAEDVWNVAWDLPAGDARAFVSRLTPEACNGLLSEADILELKGRVGWARWPEHAAGDRMAMLQARLESMSLRLADAIALAGSAQAQVDDVGRQYQRLASRADCGRSALARVADVERDMARLDGIDPEAADGPIGAAGRMRYLLETMMTTAQSEIGGVVARQRAAVAELTNATATIDSIRAAMAATEKDITAMAVAADTTA
ncbi:MAG: hypothetical protein ABIL58_19925 [Pseudomonadota bacterium]